MNKYLHFQRIVNAHARNVIFPYERLHNLYRFMYENAWQTKSEHHESAARIQRTQLHRSSLAAVCIHTSTATFCFRFYPILFVVKIPPHSTRTTHNKFASRSCSVWRALNWPLICVYAIGEQVRRKYSELMDLCRPHAHSRTRYINACRGDACIRPRHAFVLCCVRTPQIQFTWETFSFALLRYELRFNFKWTAERFCAVERLENTRYKFVWGFFLVCDILPFVFIQRFCWFFFFKDGRINIDKTTFVVFVIKSINFTGRSDSISNKNHTKKKKKSQTQTKKHCQVKSQRLPCNSKWTNIIFAMSVPNGKPPQKTTSKTPEQLNMPFSQTHSWMNGKRTFNTIGWRHQVMTRRRTKRIYKTIYQTAFQ